MDAISQTPFSSAFSWRKMYKFQLRFHLSLFLWVQLIIFQHWFRKWLGVVQAASHYLNQWWLVYRCIYASLGLNELKMNVKLLIVHWYSHLGVCRVLLPCFLRGGVLGGCVMPSMTATDWRRSMPEPTAKLPPPANRLRRTLRTSHLGPDKEEPKVLFSTGIIVYETYSYNKQTCYCVELNIPLQSSLISISWFTLLHGNRPPWISQEPWFDLIW